MRTLFFLIFIICCSISVHAQSVYMPLNGVYHHIVDRDEILGGKINEAIHTSFKPYRRQDMVDTFKDSTLVNNSHVDLANRQYILNENNEYYSTEKSRKPLLKKFYQWPANMVQVEKKDFELRVNPVFQFGMGRDVNSSKRPFINTRGLEFRGNIDERVSFYSFLAENQAIYPRYVQDVVDGSGYVANEGFWKKFSDIGVDFFTTRGYIQFKATKHIDLQFGHDRNFIGNGYRSLLLSDFGPSYPFLKLQTKVWKIQYTNLYTQLVADAPFTSGPLGGSLGTEEFPNKFMTLHHLSINLGEKFNLGIFESVIFHRGDSISNVFELNYLNPIIFYRSVEQQVGSPDNAFFGIDFKWNIRKGISVYGQGMLDEIVVGELTSGNGWWSNKYALQIGSKYINAFGVPQLDFQFEYNFARPFTYSHVSMFTNYSHYRQPLAHPVGANFKELLFIVRYQPLPKMFISSKLIQNNYGRDPEGMNLGGDILKSYIDPTSEFNNETGQGVKHELIFADFQISYMLKHNLFIDLGHVYRRLKIESLPTETTQFTSLSIRLNIAPRDHSF